MKVQLTTSEERKEEARPITSQEHADKDGCAGAASKQGLHVEVVNDAAPGIAHRSTDKPPSSTRLKLFLEENLPTFVHSLPRASQILGQAIKRTLGFLFQAVKYVASSLLVVTVVGVWLSARWLNGYQKSQSDAALRRQVFGDRSQIILEITSEAEQEVATRSKDWILTIWQQASHKPSERCMGFSEQDARQARVQLVVANGRKFYGLINKAKSLFPKVKVQRDADHLYATFTHIFDKGLTSSNVEAEVGRRGHEFYAEMKRFVDELTDITKREASDDAGGLPEGFGDRKLPTGLQFGN